MQVKYQKFVFYRFPFFNKIFTPASTFLYSTFDLNYIFVHQIVYELFMSNFFHQIFMKVSSIIYRNIYNQQKNYYS